MRIFALAIGMVLTAIVAEYAYAQPLSLAGYSHPRARASVYDWSGLYFGGNFGYGGGGLNGNSAGTGSPYSASTKGYLGGAQLGYNKQVGRWVAGLETDYQWANLTGSRVDPACFGGVCISGSDHNSARVSSFGTTRGRVGYAFDNLLLYGTGGLAYGQVKTSNTLNITGCCSFVTEQKAFGLGYALGGGLEYGFAKNWSAKLEYLYLNFGLGSSNTSGFGAISARAHDNIGRFGINYRF